MEKQLLRLFEESKKSKRNFLALKNLAIRCQLFELSATFRGIEKDLFPESDEQKAAKERNKSLSALFLKAGIKSSNGVCWVADHLISLYDKNNGNVTDEEISLALNFQKTVFEGHEE